MSADRVCTKCGGLMRCRSSKRTGSSQTQYLECRRCGTKRRDVLPAHLIFRRRL